MTGQSKQRSSGRGAQEVSKKTQQHKNVLTMAFKFSDIESQCKAIKPCNTNPAASEGRRSSLKTENGRKNFVLNYLMKG